jgi:poly(A) polymerase
VLDAVFAEGHSTPQEHAQKQEFIRQALMDTDRRVGEGKPVAPSFLLSCLLWHDVLAGWQQRRAAGEATVPALQQAVDAVFAARIGDISGGGKLGADMREIWMMQPRFERRQSNTAFSLIEQVRFRAAFDFLRLRADVGEAPIELAEWWEDFSLGSDEEREALLVAAREAQRPRKAAPRGAKPADPADAAHETAAAQASAEREQDDEADEADASAVDAPARKRRRRRRKPAGASGAAAGAATSET